MLAGLSRMAAPVSAQQAGQRPIVVYSSLVALLAIGAVLTFKAYSRSERHEGEVSI